MTQGPIDLIHEYMSIVSDTEVPKLFHRWSIITAIGALFGRSVWVDAGIDKYYPNLYVMFVAPPGTKKSTAIKLVKRFLKAAGYDKFSAERTTKEKFLIDLANSVSDDDSSFLEQNIFHDLGTIGEEREVFITADEFTNFFGNSILDFVSLLGELWDFKGDYVLKQKNSDDVYVPNPTVSILSGCTPETMHNTFPAAIIGQGFFSRLLFVYAKSNQNPIAFPSPIDGDVVDEFASKLVEIKTRIAGELKFTPGARKMLEGIYTKPVNIPDSRFTYYAARRFPQLLKLSLVHALAAGSSAVDVIHVRRANTVLTHTEYFMPYALGAMGRSGNSVVTHKVLEILDANPGGILLVDIWPQVMHDLNELRNLVDIMTNLISAGMARADSMTYFPIKRERKEPDKPEYCWDYLTDEERG